MADRPRRRTPRLLAALALLLALGSSTVSSAASLGGLHTQHLGGAVASVHQVDAVTLTWTPQWQSDAWQVAAVQIAAPGARGFLAGDTVRVMIDATCELVTSIETSTSVLTFDADHFTQACGQQPALSVDSRVALAVTGTDGTTMVSNMGDLSGSMAAFAAPVARAGTATATTEDGYLAGVSIDVPGIDPTSLSGAPVALAVTSATGMTTATVPVTSVTATDGGARVTVDVSAQRWSTATDLRIDAAITVAQRLVSGADAATGLTLATVSVDAERTPTESAIDPVETSDGITYERTDPWQGAWPNQLAFTHKFTVTNTTDAPLENWWIVLDTRLAPMWGLDPTEPGVVDLFSGLQTVDFDRDTGLWTIGGAGWAQTIPPGEKREFGFNVNRVPAPPLDPALFDTTFSAVPQDDGSTAVTVTITSTSEFYVPWQAELDLADLVCADALGNHSLSFETGSVVPTAVDGSSTRFDLTGAYDLWLVSASVPRTLPVATFHPDPDWDGTGCAGVG